MKFWSFTHLLCMVDFLVLQGRLITNMAINTIFVCLLLFIIVITHLFVGVI